MASYGWQRNYPTMWLHTSVSQGFVPDSWCKLGSSHTAYLQLICVVPSDVISHLGLCFYANYTKKNKGGIYGAQRAKTGLNVYRSGFLTRTGSDIALLVFLCWPLTGLTPVFGLWVGAGSLAAADPPAAVPAALQPGGPGRPAAIHSVPRDPTKAENVSCVLTGWQCCQYFQGTMSVNIISVHFSISQGCK